MTTTRGVERREWGAWDARGIVGLVWAVVLAMVAMGGRGARAYTHARDVGLLATATPPTTSALGTVGGVDVYGLNFAPGTSSAASVPGQLKCIFGGSPGEGYDATTVSGTTAVRCDTPSGREGFVALGLSSNGGVDAILFHELGMSSVVNFVREYKGTLTRSSPHAASQGDVARLTGRNALPPDGRADIVGSERVCEWRSAAKGGFEMSYSGVGVYVSSALVMCEVPRFAASSASVEESSMYTIGDTRVALVERVNLDVLNVTTMTPTAASDVGGNAVTITVVGALGSAFTDDGVPYVRFGSIVVAASATNAYTVSVITPAMKPESSKDVWVAAVPSMNSGRREDGESLTSVTQSYQASCPEWRAGRNP